MGVVLSKSVLSPLSLVSVVVGFVGFAFTLGTFLKVLWVNFVSGSHMTSPLLHTLWMVE